MIELNIKEIVEAVGGSLVFPNGVPNNDAEALIEKKVSGITFDSREAGKDWLFIALRGERADGHDYVKRIEDIVCAAVVERPLEAGCVQIVVPSSYAAVAAIGALIRNKSGVMVVGVTGSVGKTSVKELTACVLSQRYSVLKTEGNFNNELGLPRTLFRLEPENDIAVLEMGISHFGEMTRLSAVARPDFAVFTNIENVHTEHLIDRDGVLKAKTELVANMRGETLILNGDDDKLAGYTLPGGKRAVYYGMRPGCSVTASDIVYHGVESTDFTLHCGLGGIRVSLPAAGSHMVINALAAAACGSEFGLKLEEIKNGLESYKPVKGRMRRIEWRGAVLLDDCYNASPASVKASLSVLASEKGRKIAVLGDMLELGESSSEMHQSAGMAAAAAGPDLLITVGANSAETARAAKAGGIAEVYHLDKEEAAEMLRAVIRPGDIVLFKASRVIALETIIESLVNSES